MAGLRSEFFAIEYGPVSRHRCITMNGLGAFIGKNVPLGETFIGRSPIDHKGTNDAEMWWGPLGGAWNRPSALLTDHYD